jgi:hypothetical protein
VTWTELHKAVQDSGVTADVLRSAQTLLKTPTAMIVVYNDAVTGNGTMTPEAEAEAECMVSVLARIWKAHE